MNPSLQTKYHTSISIKHSATGYSAIFNDAKKTRIATAFLPENLLTFQKSSGKESAPLHAELQKRFNFSSKIRDSFTCKKNSMSSEK